MNISLVFPPFYLGSMYNLPPLGLINLATSIGDLSHRVRIHDFVLDLRRGRIPMDDTIYDQCARDILEKNPDVVGFSAQCTTYPPVIRIARRVKEENPHTKIVIGGHNASFLDQETLARFPFMDAVIRGEGETTFRELIEAYDKGLTAEGVAGVTWREGKNLVRNPDRPLMDHLDDIPYADYSLVPPLEEYRKACDLPRSIAILEVGRGCPHRCVYCSESMLWQRRVRTFSIDRLINEMHHLHENAGAQCFLLSYDQFTANRRFVEEFCERVINTGLNEVPWYCISRLDTVDGPLLERMRKAGCESMCYGIDSGSKRTLAFINKKIDHDILYKRVRQTTDMGMVPTLSFIVGFPEEEQKDIDDTLTLALKTGIQGNSNPLVQMPTVLPGTDLFAGYGNTLVREVDTYFSLGLEFHKGKRLAGDDALINSDPAMFSSFYNIPCKGMSLQDLHFIATYFPYVLNLYPKTFLLLCRAREDSPSRLFLELLNRVKMHTQYDTDSFSAALCYQYMPEFVHDLMEKEVLSGWDHLLEVLNYESAAIEVGKFSGKSANGNIDLTGLKGWIPKARKNLMIRRFGFNLPQIIEDMKAGRYHEAYSPEQVWLVFHQVDKELEVTEINEFGKEFLQLCDGKTPLNDIAEQLYPRWGRDMEHGAFVEACREAIQGLAELEFIESA